MYFDIENQEIEKLDIDADSFYSQLDSELAIPPQDRPIVPPPSELIWGMPTSMELKPAAMESLIRFKIKLDEERHLARGLAAFDLFVASAKRQTYAKHTLMDCISKEHEIYQQELNNPIVPPSTELIWGLPSDMALGPKSMACFQDFMTKLYEERRQSNSVKAFDLIVAAAKRQTKEKLQGVKTTPNKIEVEKKRENIPIVPPPSELIWGMSAGTEMNSERTKILKEFLVTKDEERYQKHGKLPYDLFVAAAKKQTEEKLKILEWKPQEKVENDEKDSNKFSSKIINGGKKVLSFFKNFGN